IQTYSFAPGDTGLVGGFFDSPRHSLSNALVEDGGNDVLGIKLVVGDDAGDRMRGRELHSFVNARRAAGKRAPKNPWEAEHVVDLVGIVRTAGGHYGHVRLSLFRHEFRRGIGHRKKDWFFGYLFEF